MGAVSRRKLGTTSAQSELEERETPDRRLVTRVHLFVFFPNPAVCRKRNFGRNFANSERKENSNSKNEISVNSDRNFGDFDRNFGDFDRKMMSVVIFLLFPRSNEKLLNTNFVQFFEIYNFCFRNFFI